MIVVAEDESRIVVTAAPEATPDELKGLLVLLPSELMVGCPVGLAVNRPAFDGPGCVLVV